MKRLILGLAMVALIASPATAQSVCGDRDEIVSRLESAYLEKQVALGLDSSGSVVELFASKNGGTFSILVSRPDGVSCLMTAGEGWLDVKLEESKGPAY